MGTIDACIGLLWGSDCDCRLFLVERNVLEVTVLFGCNVYIYISEFGICSL